MHSKNLCHLILGGAMATTLVLCLPARAQDEDLTVLVDKAMVAMKRDKWQEALQYNTLAVERFGKNSPLMIYGPRFGNIHYRKGICEMKLKLWSAAMKSFEIAYKDFPNSARAGGGNNFEKMALLRWGEAAMGAEDWELASTRFQKFLMERDKTRDKFSEGTIFLSMAICDYKIGDITSGNKNFEHAIRNKDRFHTSDTGIVTALRALVEAAIEKQDEQALMDFIRNYRGELTAAPYAMQAFSPVFVNLAGQAVRADMQRAAVALCRFVPPDDVTIEDLRTRIAALGALRGVNDGPNTVVKAQMEAGLKKLQESRDAKRGTEPAKLAVIAFIHEKNGNARGAFSAYEQLEKFYPGSEKREDNFFNLVRTSALVSAGPVTQHYGDAFIKAFPESKYVPEVRKLMLSALFHDGKYETCIEVAEPMLPTLNPGSLEHDICLHVLGGSYYYTGQNGKAQPLLDEHVAKYPESPFVVPSIYFQASNTTRLQFWAKAHKLLDAFLTTYPDSEENVFLPFALYDRATCHHAEERYEDALKDLDRVIGEFADCNAIDQAWNLRGNVQQALDNREEAEKSYATALDLAERRGNDIVAGESLLSLVALIGDPHENPDGIKDALPYADKFWKKYAEQSPYKSGVAVAQLKAMNAAGRGDEALERIRELIRELAMNPEARGLEELINSYTAAYLEKHSPEELKEHYYNFPGIRSTDRAARALLRVAVIGVFEGVLKDTDDEARKRSAEAMITVLFRELNSEFKLNNLTNFILVKVGDFLRTGTSTPREALPYFNEVLSREDQSYRFNALLGRADVLGRSDNPAELDGAIEDFNRVHADSQDKSQREFSLYRSIELLMAKKDHAKAAEQARLYLDREKTGFSKYAGKVGLLLAESFDKRSMEDDALATYVKIWTSHMGNVRVSAAAMMRWMQLMWDRNKPAAGSNARGDRQEAYEGGARYIELTGRFKDKLTDEEQELWTAVEKLVKTYEANPDIKPMAEVKKEKEEASRRR